jgi:hypothetical protein
MVTVLDGGASCGATRSPASLRSKVTATVGVAVAVGVAV